MLISPTNLVLKILLNFAHANEASKANFHENKRIIYRPPFMKKVYAATKSDTQLTECLATFFCYVYN